jgi:hypothetical protein
MRLLLALMFLLPSAALAQDLPSFLSGRAEDAAWLKGGTNDAPRALITLNSNDVEVILWLPETSPKDLHRAVYNYDVWKRTEQVEVSFQTDGAFFTGTRVLGNFSPTVTRNRTDVLDDNRVTISWTLMNKADSMAWLSKNKDALAKAVEVGQVDDTVDEYYAEIENRIETVAFVEGSHQYEGGWYRYRQVIRARNKAVESIVSTLGSKPQMSAALKAACYSTGNHQWAGPEGRKGVEFEVRGTRDGSLRPGK